jgi:antitoxin (DNA-binding transcriptional repressor) of toxin-antitoxin stability system
MKTINLHQAKTHLSKLIQEAEAGEPFVIARSGKPVVKVEAINQGKQSSRLGFMVGEGQVPDDFNSMGQDQIETMFYGTE